MSKHVTCEVLREGLTVHMAVQAWSRLEPKSIEPEAVEVLHFKPKTAVYRLIGAGRDGSTVIAKRCLRTTALVERMIYEECLPGLPIPGLTWYGFFEDPANHEFCWLFLEDASGQKYSPQCAEHRASAGRWLAAVHTSCIGKAVVGRLPQRGVGHYLQLLRSSRAMAVRHLNNPALPPEDLATLQAIASELELLKSHWHEVEAFCSTIPDTLVHGDFAIKNVGLRHDATSLTLLVFDWENGGWGVPAVDLCQFNGHTLSPDLETYSATREQRGHQLEFWKIQRLSQYGSIFRLLEDISWQAPSIAYDSYWHLAKPMSYLRVYQGRLAEAFQALDWTAQAIPGRRCADV
jgi:hypothetical protein